MATLAKLKLVAAKVGAKVEDQKIGNCHECRVEAPHRKIWKCREVHEMVDSCYRPWKPDYADMIANIEFGLEDCTDPDCEWCNDSEESE
jgi:hypothetical protein